MRVVLGGEQASTGVLGVYRSVRVRGKGEGSKDNRIREMRRGKKEIERESADDKRTVSFPFVATSTLDTQKGYVLLKNVC